MKSFNEYSQDLISRNIKEICDIKHISPYCCGKLLGIKDTVFYNAANYKGKLSLEHSFAFCLFMELSVEDSRKFLEDAGYSVANCEPYKTFVRHLEDKDYGLLSFVTDVKNMIEEDNIVRESNGLNAIKIKSFYDINGITNFSYSDCLDKFGKFSKDIGEELLEKQSIK